MTFKSKWDVKTIYTILSLPMRRAYLDLIYLLLQFKIWKYICMLYTGIPFLKLSHSEEQVQCLK